MGSAPGTIPPAAGATSTNTTQPAPDLKDRFTLYCVYHGVVSEFNSEADALAAAAKHIEEKHAAAKGVELEILAKAIFTS